MGTSRFFSAKVPDVGWILRNRFLPGYFWEKDHEPEVQHFLKQFTGQVFWDVGAGRGTYALLLRENFQRVVAFEPNPENRRAIERRVARKSICNVTVLPFAMSNHSGSERFFLSTDKRQLWSGFFTPREQASGEVTVDTRTMDELLVEGPVDLVKIDTEGTEFRILEGARHSLDRLLVRRWLVELHSPDRKAELENLFTGRGYRISWRDRSHLFAQVMSNVRSFGTSLMDELLVGGW